MASATQCDQCRQFNTGSPYVTATKHGTMRVYELCSSRCLADFATADADASDATTAMLAGVYR